MRRVITTGIVVIALGSGCGGGSHGTGSGPAAGSGSQGSGATTTAQPTAGRLGDAVVARPGSTKVTGHGGKLDAHAVRPPAGTHGVGAEADCADTDVQPTTQNLSHVSDVVFCLMNAMRSDAGLPALTKQDELAKASVEHSQDMVDNKYFAHDSLDGRDVVARLTQVGYIPKAGEWVVGENLAWGSGALATPKALVNAWMNSPPHRENLLAPDFKEVGMGVVFGTPSKDASAGVTVTTDFGTRVADEPASAGNTATGTAAAVKARRSAAARRKTALRRCTRRHGKSKRRCVRAARKIR
jgi:uncharacterized protein YkwD